MERKRELRPLLLAQREALSAEERTARSAAAGERLFSLPEFRAAQAVMFFVSFGSEIATLPMISRALAEGRQVAAPRVERASRRLMPYAVRDLPSDLTPGVYGILEPKPDRLPVPLDRIDVVIVPAVAWDEEGFRVGYGGGYYDRFLLQVGQAARVGLGFELQVLPEVPRSAEDLPVDVLVTDKTVRRFPRRREG
jgi:5-formyltetrahydrofolate cyclo-ligase